MIGAHQPEQVKLLNRYFTPFAVALIVAGLALGRPGPRVTAVCVGLLVCSSVFNEATAGGSRRHAEAARLIGQARVGVNFLVNAVFVYLLAGVWEPIWMLFMLTPVATAVYADRETTVVSAISVSALLLFVYFLRGLQSGVNWGQIGMHVAFIIFLSLFINALVQSTRSSQN